MFGNFIFSADKYMVADKEALFFTGVSTSEIINTFFSNYIKIYRKLDSAVKNSRYSTIINKSSANY